MTAGVVNATTVYYDCYSGGTVLVGGNALAIGACEISMGLSASHFGDTVLQPYDVFAVDNSGTLVMCIGPQWSSSTARSTAIDQTSNGLWTNATSMTHCYGGAAGNTDYGTVGAHAGTLLGTIAPVSAGKTQMDLSRLESFGANTSYNLVSNAYNRVPITTGVSTSFGSYTVSSATWRAIDACSPCGVLVIDSLGQGPYVSTYTVYTQSLATGHPEISIDNVQQCGAGFSPPNAATVAGFPVSVSSTLSVRKAGVLSLGGDVSDANNLFVPCERTSFGNVTFGDGTATYGTNTLITADM
jgi:hypothetical protein